MVFPSSLLFIYNLKSKPKLSHCHVEIIKQQKNSGKDINLHSRFPRTCYCRICVGYFLQFVNKMICACFQVSTQTAEWFKSKAEARVTFLMYFLIL